MGALTVTLKEDKSIIEKCGHGYKMITGSVAFTGTYSTNGETLDLRKILPIDVHMVMITPSGGYSFEYDYTARKVKAFTPAPTHNHNLLAKGGLTESENLCLDSAQKFGKNAATDRTITSSTANGGVVAAAAAAAAEVGSGTNLTALTDVRFVAIGK